nr:BTG16 [Cercospora sp. JNU001]
MTTNPEVIIVGGGAVGLAAACELALKNVSVTILERESGPAAPWKNEKLGFRELFVPAIEHLYRRGLLNDMFRNEERPQTMPEKKGGFEFAGHFAGMMINGNDVNYSHWDDTHLPGPACVPGSSTLGHIENVLRARAEQLKVPILTGKNVTGIEDTDSGVKVFCGEETFEAQYLVGCDGGRSTIRKQAGIPFIGTEPEFTGYAVHCKLDNPFLLKPGFNRCPNGGLYIMAGPQHIYAVDHDTSFDRDQEVTAEHFQKVLRKLSGTNVVVEQVVLASAFTDRCRQAEQYRKGRVFLAGDAAHIYPPFSAQGLNCGYIDAVNLGWKLAALVKGYATPGLIDTYQQEQHPMAARVLDWVRAQIVTLRPDAHGRAVGNVMREFLYTEAGVTYCIGRQWGLDVRYEIGEEHKLVGRSALDYELDDGSRLGTKLGAANFTLVAFGDCSSELTSSINELSPVLGFCRAKGEEKSGLKGVLVRPDGIVSWATTEALNIEYIKASLERWVALPAAVEKFEAVSYEANQLSNVQTPLTTTVRSNIGRVFGKDGEKYTGLPTVVTEVPATADA